MWISISAAAPSMCGRVYVRQSVAGEFVGCAAGVCESASGVCAAVPVFVLSMRERVCVRECV